MNQLHYTKKFMVLGVIFLIAVIEVIYSLTANIGLTIMNGRHELDGLDIISPISNTIQLVQQHRGLTSGAISSNKNMLNLHTVKGEKVASLLNFIDKKLHKNASEQADWLAIKKSWENIHANSLHWTIDESMFAHTHFIETLQAFNVRIADHYLLSSDPAIDSHYLLQTTITNLPETLELLGQIRGFGTGILAKKKMSDSQSFEMRALIERLRNSVKSLKVNLEKAGQYSPQIKTELIDTSNAINIASQQIITLVETDILAANFRTPSDQFYALVTAKIDGGNRQLHQTLLPTTKLLLNTRILQAEKTLYLRSGTAILLLLLSYYLFISIYFSTIDSIKALAHSAKKIAGGDLNERVSLNTRDELSVVGDSFNEMAIGFNALMLTRIEDEARLRAILDGALDAAIQMDAKGNIRGWSVQAQNIFGWSGEEVVGHPLHDFIIPVRYREAHKQGLKHFLASGEGPVLQSRIEVEGLHRLGHEFPIELAISPVRSAGEIEFNAFIRDISQRKKSEDELRIAAIAFESLEGMIVTDANKIIINVNQAFTQITGYSVDEVVGKSPSILQSGRHNDLFYQELWSGLNQNKFWYGEVWNKRKSGEIYPELFRISAVTNKYGQVTNYLAAFTDISESKKSEDVINALSFYDALTHLPNRKLMLDRLNQLLESSVKNQQYGAILSLDLDNFKILNDTKGHDIGDLMLIEVAKRLKTCTHAKDTISRIGGDEFVVLLSELSTDNLHAANLVEAVAERVRAALKLPFKLLDGEYHSSVSIGICLFLNHDLSVDELFKRADSAMHQAKQSGRNAIRFFDTTTQTALESRVLLESMLRNAIPDQFILYYQPQVDDAGHIIGAEALIRWLHPKNGLISPAMFIPLAEETGLILPIGDWVMESACQQLKAWESNPKLQHLQLAVNVSAKQFQQQEFVAKVLSVLDQTGANPTKLKLELTESLVVDDVDMMIAKMGALKAVGVSFSLDDFGTGFSSLSYLKRLPLNQLKIDQSFVRNLLEDPNDEAIVRTVIALGHAMGLSVIAEGVETKEQRDFLYTHGCLHYQGYLFGRPLQLISFENLLK